MKIYSLPYTQDFQFLTLRVASFAQQIHNDGDVSPSLKYISDEVRAFAIALSSKLERLEPHEE